MWNDFKTMPKDGRPILVAYIFYDEAGNYSARLEIITLLQVPFGFTAYRNGGREQISRAEEAAIERGRWTYAVDVFKTADVDLSVADHVYFKGDRPYEGNLKGESFDI